MPMKNITVNVPDPIFECIMTLVTQSIYPSRSEVFREAIKRFLNKEAQIKEQFNDQRFTEMIKNKLVTPP